MARLWFVIMAALVAVAASPSGASAMQPSWPSTGMTPGGHVAQVVKRMSIREAAKAHSPTQHVSRSLAPRLLDPNVAAAAKAHPRGSGAVVHTVAPRTALRPELPVVAGPITLESHDTALTFFGQDIEPPDTQVAVGPTQVLETVNNVLHVTDRNDTNLATIDLNSFFSTPAGFGLSDPRVLYDAESGRWFASALAFQTSPSFASRVLIAVSTSSDALQPFVFYQPLTTSNVICDQPKIGVDTDKVTMSCAGFTSTSFDRQASEVINKAEMMAAVTTHIWLFLDTGLFNAVPAVSLTPTTTAFMVENGSLFSPMASVCHTVALTAFTGVPSAATPNPTAANRTDTCLPFTATSMPPPAAQPNGGHTIDTNDDRFTSATWQSGTLWTGGNDACTPSGDQTVRSCMRLVEVSTGGPSVSSSFDVAMSTFYLMYPAVTMDPLGDLFIGFSSSSPLMSSPVMANSFPTVGVASIPVASQASGTPDLVDLPTGLGSAVYTDSFNQFRWGDYSSAVPDPAQPGAVWLAGEYSTPSPTGHPDRSWGTAVVKMSEAPAAASINPTSGPAVGGQSVTIPGTFFERGATVSFSGHLATNVVAAPDGSSITAKTPTGAGSVTVTVTNPDGQSTTVPGGYTFNPPAATGTSFFFAEGTTLNGFNETLYLLMPNSSGSAQVTYFTEAGPVGPVAHALTAGQVTPVSVLADVGANHAVSARVDLPAPGVAERQLNFTFGQWHGSTDKVGVAGPNTEWDFAEGSTLSIFTEFLTLQNPGASPSNVSINYFTDQGVKVTKTIVLPPGTRTTVRVADGNQTNTTCAISSSGDAINCGVGAGFNGVSTQVVVNSGPAIIAERPFYVNGFSFGSGVIRDGHVAFGANRPAATWNFAEGTTIGGFNEFLTLQNPGTTASNVTVTYFTSAGQTVVRNLTLPATSRTTLNVNLGNTSPGPSTCAVSGGQAANCGVGAGVVGVSASVTVTGGPNIVVERPMYLFRDFGSGPVAGATDVVGANSLGTLFGFSSSQTTAGENDFLTIQNPGSGQATVTITYYDAAAGFPLTGTVVVPANTRQTVQVFAPPFFLTGGAGPGLANLGIVVSSDVPVLVEKPTYNSTAARFGATDTLGFTPSPAF